MTNPNQPELPAPLFRSFKPATDQSAGYVCYSFTEQQMREYGAACATHAASRPADGGISYWATQYPGKLPKLYGVRHIAELNWYPDEGGELIRLQEVERVAPSAPTSAQAGDGIDLSRFRPAVAAWRAMAGVGEIADSVRVPFKLTPEQYQERMREAEELLAIIDANEPPTFHLRSYGDVTESELKRLTAPTPNAAALSKSTAKRVTALRNADAAARARDVITTTIGYEFGTDSLQPVNDHDMGNLADAFAALITTPSDAGGDREDEDYHVIMTMGRLLAEIAVILKGTEPAGSAWSYHDLPELVKSSMENAHDIASEMRAWAAIKMRERGSSRRDKMMVEEWSKRLLALPEVTFPVKDFDIPGLSITKEEIRFAIRKVVEDRVFIGQDFGDTPPNPGDARLRALADRWMVESNWRTGGVGATYKRCADELLSLLDGKGVAP